MLLVSILPPAALLALVLLPAAMLAVLLPSTLLVLALLGLILLTAALFVAAPPATLTAVLGGLAPVTGLVDAKLLAAALVTGLLLAAPAAGPLPAALTAGLTPAAVLVAGLTAFRPLSAGLAELALSALSLLPLATLSLLGAALASVAALGVTLAAAATRLRSTAAAGFPVATIASRLTAPPVLVAPVVGAAAREVLAVFRAPFPLALTVLRPAVLLPAGLFALAVRVASGAGRAFLPTAHVALLLAGLAVGTAGAALLLAPFVGVAALVLALSSLSALARHLALAPARPVPLSAPGPPAIAAGLLSVNVAVLFGGVDPAESRRTVVLVAFSLVGPAVGVALPSGSAAAFSSGVVVPFASSIAALPLAFLATVLS